MTLTIYLIDDDRKDQGSTIAALDCLTTHLLPLNASLNEFQEEIKTKETSRLKQIIFYSDDKISVTN